MKPIRALAAKDAQSKLEPFEYTPGPLNADQVDIDVHYCGICHSDLSMLRNEWGMTSYPFVPGHEIVGKIAGKGEHVPLLKVGQTVGLGWYAGSCLACQNCLAGDHNLCQTGEATIIKRHGGFATSVRCQWIWATPLPDSLDPVSAGPLFCGGITVFNPLVQHSLKPTARAGVVGIGGLGHLGLQFLRKWGCEVIAFSSNPSKREEALKFGAHQVVDSRTASEQLKSSLDLILVTANVPLDWEAYLALLAPKGTLHFVGAVPQPISVSAFTLLAGQKSVSGSPLGSPATTRSMIEFCTRHQIAPLIERFPMSQANEALEHLEAGKARYRIVLENDL
jgi:alcohol/geraniol dehydrogenase (NADP+)